ncbi:amidase [Hyphobacterium sp. HN65]|uniref:Amidase n=1 Tax=Hyphobacterium lacteum TaxID=3116575 RepID=A0ABU7LTI1_9PROT|nr:amidase [Hyphobacterium sp. HN65]MEE2527230.1 amidase [Hyphobacterium sp. HN65]
MATTRRELLGGLAVGAGALAAGPAGAQERLTAESLDCAGGVFGVDYTGEEIEQMLIGLDDWADSMARFRAIDQPNTLQPATVFDPRLPGVAYDLPESGISLRSDGSSAMPVSDADIAFSPAWQQSAWLRNGQITSRRLTEIYLSRIERFSGELECFITVTPDIALAQADEADAAFARGEVAGPLQGLPYAMKDIIDIAGIRSTWGATPFQDRIAEETATVAANLRAAGAVLLGKSTSGAIAYNDLWFDGLTRNPWNTDEGSSGSSAGSASAVAAGLASFAIGTETLGSIISPSHRCGATGLRPTFGRVSRAGAMALCWSLDKIGPITRDVTDTGLVLAAINGSDPKDASSSDSAFGIDWSTDPSSFRVGYIPEIMENAAEPDRAAMQAVRDLGCELVEISLPELPYGALSTILQVEAAAAFEELTLSGRDDDLRWQEPRAWPNTWRRARLNSAVDFVNVDRFRRDVCQMMHSVFEDCDVIIGPNFAASMLLITNFTGHPSLILRSGFTERTLNPLTASGAERQEETFRMPYGSSLWAPLFREDRLILLGRAIQDRLGVANERPEAFS